jgi:DNA polymerase-3 subunit epsilon
VDTLWGAGHGLCGAGVTKDTNYLVLGNNDYCTSIKDGKSSKQKKAEKYKAAGMDIEIISENIFYEMIAEAQQENPTL